MARRNASNLVEVYRLEASGTVESRRWELMFTRSAMFGQPALLVSPDYENPTTSSRVFVVGLSSTGKAIVDQSAPTTSGSWWLSTWRTR